MASKPRLKANGINIATPFDGPKPGNAPTMVPITHPTIARNRVDGPNATLKPKARFANNSI